MYKIIRFLPQRPPPQAHSLAHSAPGEGRDVPTEFVKLPAASARGARAHARPFLTERRQARQRSAHTHRGKTRLEEPLEGVDKGGIGRLEAKLAANAPES